MGARIRAAHAGGELSAEQARSPLLELVLHGDEGRSLADDRLYTLLVPILFGGHETTGFTLAWSLYELARDRALERRYLDELRAFRAALPGAVADHRHVEERPVQQALLYEIGRRYPPVPAIPRSSIRAGEVPPDPETGIGAFAYPKGALFLASIGSVHLDEDLYPDPLRFDVQRWLAGTEGLSRREAGRAVRTRYLQAERGFRYIGFGGGPGKCLGQAFNQLELNWCSTTCWPATASSW